MTIFCNKCLGQFSGEELDTSETPDGYMSFCPACGDPLSAITHEEAEEEVLFLDKEQSLYLSHILDKQLDKLDRATDIVTSIREQLA